MQRKLLVIATMNAIAAMGITSAAFAQTQTVERVEITGSSIKRVDAEGALPVQVLTREDIARTGATSTEQLLSSISAISSAGATVNATGAGSSTYGFSSISLRGLGDERSLVLVNGRRVAAQAGLGGTAVNVNTIPIAAIERVEVLKDGASAVYGSDAVAGVVNFILTKDFRGAEIGVKYGAPTRSGGGENLQVSAVAGMGSLAKQGFNVTISGTYEKEDALFAKDRAFAKTGNQFPFIVAGATGQGNIEGAYTPGSRNAAGVWTEGKPVDGFGASPGRGYGNPLAAQDKCGDINMFKNPTNTAKGVPFCAFDSSGFVGLTPKRELTSFTANGTFKLNSQHELFGDFLYSESAVTQQFQPSPVRRSFLTSDALFQQQGVDPALLLRPSNPNYATAAAYLNANGFGSLVGQTLAVTSRVFDFGLRTSLDESQQSRLVVGARGTVAGQDYEVAYSRNESKLVGTVPDGYFSQVAFAKVVNAANSDYNPWSLTQSAAFNAALAAANAKYTGNTQTAKSTSDNFDGRLTGEVWKLPAGILQYAAGLQYRSEKYVTNPSPALETGDIAGLGGATPPVDRSRNVTSGFVELNAPLLKTLEASASLRHDRYNDVGGSTNYKANLRFNPTKQVLFRASIGTGFRAPTLSDLWLPQSVGTSEGFTDPGRGTNIQVPALTGGNPGLKPEKSDQSSFGVVFSPINNLTLSADYFRVKMTDVITVPSAQLIVSRFRAGDPAYRNLVTLNASGDVDQIVAISSNTGALVVEGFDLGANYRHKFAAGTLDLGLSGTYMKKFDETTPSGAISYKVGTIVDANGDPVLGADNGGVVLRWKHALSATFTRGPFAATLTQNYIRGYEAGLRQIDGERSFIPSYSLYDLNLAYSGIKNLRLSLGGKNVFDKDPPIFVPASNQFQAGYDITQYDPRGRFVYVGANYSFK
ncbi:MAG: TonB-dependent receptor [Betaproteobacteria bacterium]|nr:MAG: TonB-dependent receptor [Betaproteobacteria bacterium]TAG47617.1 MAG: TonB-dependent receptor [Betaproteobacteria bacterium]